MRISSDTNKKYKLLCYNYAMILGNYTNKQIYFRSIYHPQDLQYKKALQKGLKDSFGINCKIEDFNSIAGPEEIKTIISRLKPYQYEVGDNFRANFHLHTKASDGNLTPKEFLEKCVDWANHIFKSGKTNDNLPAFSASITDHDRIESVKETIALISQNPDKYKNFKFISGCEFLFHGYKEPYSAFEAVGLGFNPFDKNIQNLMKGFASNNHVTEAQKVLNAGGILSWAHPLITPEKLNEDFFTFLKSHGINGVEGNYQYQHWDKEYINTIKPILDKFIKQFKMFVTGGTDSHRKSIF